ncbi:MAG TPA: hypothetical protein V6D05_13380 [Stenomitos sp.]
MRALPILFTLGFILSGCADLLGITSCPKSQEGNARIYYVDLPKQVVANAPFSILIRFYQLGGQQTSRALPETFKATVDQSLKTVTVTGRMVTSWDACGVQVQGFWKNDESVMLDLTLAPGTYSVVIPSDYFDGSPRHNAPTASASRELAVI